MPGLGLFELFVLYIVVRSVLKFSGAILPQSVARWTHRPLYLAFYVTVLTMTCLPAFYEFDVRKCIDLHNKIVEKAIAQGLAGTPKKGLGTVSFKETFSGYRHGGPFGEIYTEYTSHLLQNFLNGINIPNDGGKTPLTPHLFTPHPQNFFVYNEWDKKEEYPYLLLLYPNTVGEGGLFFDQQTNMVALMSSSPSQTHEGHDHGGDHDHSHDETPPPPLPAKSEWYTLESALQRYLDLYESGRFQPDEIIQPWVKQDLVDTLRAWDQLLDAIVARVSGFDDVVPSLSAYPEANSGISPPPKGFPSLVTSTVLDTNNIGGFAYEYLIRARRPPSPILHIAPGIGVWNDTLLEELIAADNLAASTQPPVLDDFSLPMLLFPSVPPTPLYDVHQTMHHPSSILSYLLANISGVYAMPPSDEMQFVLPYSVGGPGQLSYANGEFSVQGNDALFQHGRCPFLPSHYTRVKTLLEVWKCMVESGIWPIGEQGVEGGIEWWRQYDNRDWYENHGETCSVGVCW